MKSFSTFTWLVCVLILFFSLNSAAQLQVEMDKNIGGLQQEELDALLVSADGNYLLAGTTSSGVSGNKTIPSKGMGDYWLVNTAPPLIPKPKVMMEWDKTHDDNPGSLMKGTLKKVVATADGGFMLGETSPFRFGSWTDYRIIKLDAAGNWLWEKSYGGNHQESLSALIALPDGGFLLAGYSKSGISLDKTTENKGSEGSPDYWVVRIDAQGNKLWDKTFGTASDDYLSAAVATADGGFLLAGNSFSYPQGFLLVRIDASGNVLWENTLSSGNFLTALTNAADGNGFLVGSIRGRRDGLGPADYWVLRIDSKGDKMWEKTYGGLEFDWLAALAPVADGGFIIGGWSFSNASGEKSQDSRGISDFWVIRVDAAGGIVWEKIYGGNSSEKLVDILATEDGGFVLAGNSRSDISYDKSGGNRGNMDYWAIKIDVNGNKLWDITTGASNYENLVGLAEAADGGFLLAGNSISGISGEKSEATEGLWMVRVRETSEGMLSGGGWFDSPGGAYLSDPFIEGRAHFALALQSGETGSIKGIASFRFPEAQLNFRSTAIDWLAMIEGKAMVTGSGALNREEGYRFFISVEDQNQKGSADFKDLYRIIIWNPFGIIMYDNQRGHAWDMPVKFHISAGNIHIRPFEKKPIAKAGKQQHLRYQTGIKTVLEGFNAYPLPLGKDGLWLEFPEGNTERTLQITIYDMQGRSMALKSIHLGRAAEKHLWELDHSEWPKGVYLISISGKHLLHQQKLLK